MTNEPPDVLPVQPDESEAQRSGFFEDVAKLTTAGILAEGLKYGLVRGAAPVADKMRPHGKHQGQDQPGPTTGQDQES